MQATSSADQNMNISRNNFITVKGLNMETLSTSTIMSSARKRGLGGEPWYISVRR